MTLPRIALTTALLCALVPSLALADPNEPVPANLGEHRSRVESLDQTAAELRDARARVLDLQQQRARQRQNRYPRGEAKAEMEEAWRLAVNEEARLERRWADLLEKARREGVPPGVLRRYRDSDG